MATFNTGTTLFRSALLIESAMNIFGGSGMILFPSAILRSMTYPTTPITPAATNLMQWLGGLVIALSTPLLLSYPNTVAGVASRYTTYWTLAAGEVVLMSVMAVQATSGRNAVTGRFVGAAWGILGVTLAWRVYALVFRPEMIGSVGNARKGI